jgi:hypothetical protein
MLLVKTESWKVNLDKFDPKVQALSPTKLRKTRKKEEINL